MDFRTRAVDFIIRIYQQVVRIGREAREKQDWGSRVGKIKGPEQLANGMVVKVLETRHTQQIAGEYSSPEGCRVRNKEWVRPMPKGTGTWDEKSKCAASNAYFVRVVSVKRT
jgi:hypothetical protein